MLSTSLFEICRQLERKGVSDDQILKFIKISLKYFLNVYPLSYTTMFMSNYNDIWKPFRLTMMSTEYIIFRWWRAVYALFQKNCEVCNTSCKGKCKFSPNIKRIAKKFKVDPQDLILIFDVFSPLEIDSLRNKAKITSICTNKFCNNTKPFESLINYLVFKKLKFIYTHNAFDARDMKQELLAQAVRLMYRYSNIMDEAKFVNTVKLGIKNASVNIIRSFTTQSRSRLVSDDIGYKTTVSTFDDAIETESDNLLEDEVLNNVTLRKVTKSLPENVRNFVWVMMGIEENQAFNEYLLKKHISPADLDIDELRKEAIEFFDISDFDLRILRSYF